MDLTDRASYFRLIVSFMIGVFSWTSFSQDEQNHWITHRYQFMTSPAMTGKTFGTKGFIINLGFNFAKLDTDKLIFGVTSDIKLMPGIITIYPNDDFSSDFKSNYITTYGSLQDSANADVVRATFLSSGALMGNTIINIGVMFSLFPQKYGGIMFQAKYGNHNVYSHAVYGNPNIEFGAYDKLPIVMNASFFELTMKPLAFFRNTYIESNTWRSGKDFANSLVLSFYYERVNFESAQFNGTKVVDMVTPEFMANYGVDHRFGFKLGVGFY